jgi:hypothetical protein
MIRLGGRTSKSARFVSVISTVVAVFFAVLVFPSIPEALTFTGKVVLTDPSEKTVAIEPLTGDLKGSVFALAENVTVIMGNTKVSFEEIIAGDRVAVNYYRQDGFNIIDVIEIATPVPEDRKYILIRKPSTVKSNVTPSGLEHKTGLLPPF